MSWIVLLLGIRKPILEKLLIPQALLEFTSCSIPNYLCYKMQSHRKLRFISPGALRTCFSFQRKNCGLVGVCEVQSKRSRPLWCIWIPGDMSNGTRWPTWKLIQLLDWKVGEGVFGFDRVLKISPIFQRKPKWFILLNMGRSVHFVREVFCFQVFKAWV